MQYDKKHTKNVRKPSAERHYNVNKLAGEYKCWPSLQFTAT